MNPQVGSVVQYRPFQSSTPVPGQVLSLNGTVATVIFWSTGFKPGYTTAADAALDPALSAPNTYNIVAGGV